MKDTVRLLEDRVGGAVRRLRELAAERERLRSKIARLESRLEQLEARSTAVEGETVGGDAAPPAWLGQRAELLRALEETAAELRGE